MELIVILVAVALYAFLLSLAYVWLWLSKGLKQHFVVCGEQIDDPSHLQNVLGRSPLEMTHGYANFAT